MQRQTSIVFIILCSILLASLFNFKENSSVPASVFISDSPPLVVDGDTIKTSYRLLGVDTPELKQQCKKDGQCYDCGKEAKAFTEKLIKQGNISCEGEKTDRYGRILATCYSGDLNINKAIVAAGYGFVDPRFQQIYKAEEQQAKAEKKGLWASEFTFPWEWRKSKSTCSSDESKK